MSKSGFTGVRGSENSYIPIYRQLPIDRLGGPILFHTASKARMGFQTTTFQVLNFMRCLSTWKIMKIVKIYRKCEIRQKKH